MADLSLFAELKRRNVFRVTIAYVVIAWLLAQVADLAFDNFGAPDWVSKSFLFVLMLGLPLAIFFAWAFELTPEGLKKESDVDRSQSITHKTGRKLDFAIIGVLVVAVGFLAIDKFRPPAEPEISTEVTVTSGTPSIAVLPFDNRSNREEDQFFTDGIHDDLLTTIANIGSMKVISRTSVMRYKDTTKNIPEIAQELGVANILEGGIQRSGNQVRINVQLIDAYTDEHLWAKIYDRQLTAENLFAIQSEVSNAIAAALQTALTPDEAKRINAVATKNLEAYEAYLLGRERWRERTKDSLAEAAELFQKAIDLDPNFALAWVGLGDAYRFQVLYGGALADEMIPKSEAAIRRALELDDQLGEAWAALGGVHRYRREYEEAEVSLSKALQLNPNYSVAYNWYGIALEDLGRFDESEKIALQGLELDPLSIILHNRYANLLTHAGEFDEALARYERMIEIDADSWLGYAGIFDYHSRVTGRLDEALMWWEKAFAVDPNSPDSFSILAATYLSLGDPENAANWLEKHDETHAEDAFSVFILALHALYVGDHDSAQQAFRRALELSPNAVLQGFMTINLYRLDSTAMDVETALAGITERFPEFGDVDSLTVSGSNSWRSIDVAQLLLDNGQEQEARRVLHKALAYSETVPMLGSWGYDWARAHIYALRGDREQALAELARVVDAGVRNFWWYHFDHASAFDSLRDDPEFKALRARVAADIAEQLARVNASENQSFVN